MIKKLYKEPDEYMVIKIGYNKGGVNNFTQNYEEKGFYIYFELKKFVDNSSIYMPQSGENFKLLVKPTRKYSERTKEKLLKIVEENRDNLFNLYELYLNGKDITKYLNSIFDIN